MLPTASFHMMSMVPPELLEASSAVAQALRRLLSCGPTLVFISAGLSGERFAFARKSMVAEGLFAKFSL